MALSKIIFRNEIKEIISFLKIILDEDISLKDIKKILILSIFSL